MTENKNLDIDVADVVMGRPYGFSVDGEYFYFYPVTLGKMYLLQRQYEALGVDVQNLQYDVSFEALRLAEEKKETCLSIISYHTCKSKDEVFDIERNKRKNAMFAEKLHKEDIATLMIYILTQDKTNLILGHLGIEKEQERIQKIIKIKFKNDKNSITTGGLSVFGTLIDMACERYGWSKDYVVWGIDYTSLRAMLGDKISSIYLTDEERKRTPASLLSGSGDVVKATKENMEQIKSWGWR